MTDETKTIERILAGDTESFRILIERHERAVVAMVAHLTGDRQRCEDLAQEVFLAAFAKLKTFDPARSRFSTWLLTIARNKSINALKKKRPQTLDDPPELIDPRTPLEAAAQREAFAQLDRVLTDLPRRQRRAFVLVEFEGLSYEQAAQIEGTRVGTIKSRVHRARAMLAKALGQNEEHDE
jgi:RNA polymerase sigma-70 factor (ECF subfamily)